jgi:hypothetical protein
LQYYFIIVTSELKIIGVTFHLVFTCKIFVQVRADKAPVSGTQTCCVCCCKEGARLFNHVVIVGFTVLIVAMITRSGIDSMYAVTAPDYAGYLWQDDGSSHLSGLIFLCIFGGCVAKVVIFTGISSYYDVTLWNKSNVNKKRYQEMFHAALLTAKVGVIAIFLIVTVVYQSMFGNIPAASTYLGSGQYFMPAIIDMSLAGGMGFLTTLFMLKTRGFSNGDTFQVSLLVGFILGLFNVSLETSGFNRYLATDQVQLGLEECPYAVISGTSNLNETGLEKFRLYEEGGPPFLISMAYTSGFLMVCLVFGMTWIMIKASIYGGFNEPDHYVVNIPQIFCGKVSSIIL